MTGATSVAALVMAAASAGAPATPVRLDVESPRNHLCWISDVAERDTGVAVQFRFPVAVLAADETGGPDKLFINTNADAAAADGSSSRPYPALVLGREGRFSFSGERAGLCHAALDRNDDGSAVLVVSASSPAQPRKEPRVVHERIAVRGPTAFAAELKAMVGSHHYYSYHRDSHSELLIMLPASLGDRPEVLGRASRISGEMADGVRLMAQAAGAQANGPVAPWHVRLFWQEMGRAGSLTSLLATGQLFRGLGHPQQTALAMLDDATTGQVLTDVTDLFEDRLAGSRSAYCRLLDIQRMSQDRSATTKRAPFGAKGRYKGQWDCPQFGELAIGFSGEDGQPLDRIVLIAPAGLAGPEAEGSYTVRMALTPAMVAAIKPAYRASFRAATVAAASAEQD